MSFCSFPFAKFSEILAGFFFSKIVWEFLAVFYLGVYSGNPWGTLEEVLVIILPWNSSGNFSRFKPLVEWCVHQTSTNLPWFALVLSTESGDPIRSFWEITSTTANVSCIRIKIRIFREFFRDFQQEITKGISLRVSGSNGVFRNLYRHSSRLLSQIYFRFFPWVLEFLSDLLNNFSGDSFGNFCGQFLVNFNIQCFLYLEFL